MVHKTMKKTKAKKPTKRALKKPKSAPAKKTKAKKPNKAIAANVGKPKEKSVAEVAAIHLENMAYDLGHLIPSAPWRHEG